MKLFSDMLIFIRSLSFVDIVFFVAIIILLILLVTLVYFVKINNDVLKEDDFFQDLKEDVNEKPEVMKIEEAKEEEKEEYNDEEGELLDLKSLTEKLKAEEHHPLGIAEYEKDQEEKAIISYDELLQKKNKYAVNYEKEEVLDDLVVKKVDLNDLVNKNIVDEIKEVRVISYEKEEAFLNALKELNKLLN